MARSRRGSRSPSTTSCASAEQLDHLGVAYIEGGYPSANPKDAEFFLRARRSSALQSAKLVAFGSTRRAGIRPQDDPLIEALLAAGTETVCIVAKSSNIHVTETLRSTLEGRDSRWWTTPLRTSSLKVARVFVDAEHFFDGYVTDQGFSLRILEAAETPWRNGPRAV